jgi:DNA-binding transcriptional regulator YiaG
VLVVAAKYFGVSVSPVTAWVMRDSTASLLAALVLSLISRWL